MRGIKKTYCLALVVAMIINIIFPVCAFAFALRTNPKAKAASRQSAKDVLFMDFTELEEGELPKGSIVSGTVTTAEYEVDGYKKNCLEILDTTSAKDYSGSSIYIPVGSHKGIMGFEVRYKYLPDSASQWNAFSVELYGDDSKNMISRTVVASADGSTNFNYGGPDSGALEKERVSHNTWYTLKYIIDFNTGMIDATLKNEGTGVVKIDPDNMFYTDETINELTKIRFLSQAYSGTWVIDYIRITKDETRIDYYSTIQKGVTPKMIQGPVSHAVSEKINICLDGKYKYTTDKPYISKIGNVMVTAKNIAAILNLNYYKNGDKYIISNNSVELAMFDGKNNAELKAKQINMPCSAEKRKNQLFVPIEFVVKQFGYNSEFKNDENVFYISKSDSFKEPDLSLGGGSLSAGSGGGGGSAVSQPTKTELLENTASFKDMENFEWANDAVSALFKKNIISGVGENKFEPGRSVKKEEFIKMIVLAFELIAKDDIRTSFNDVFDNEWYYEYIQTAFSNGIVNGDADGSLGIGRNITREDAAVIIWRTAKAAGYKLNENKSGHIFADNDGISDYAKTAVNELYENKYISGKNDNKFDPKASLLRAEAAKLIYEIIR